MNIIKAEYKIDIEHKSIDLKGRVPGTDTIEFLWVEEPYLNGRRFGPFVRVRYALNGVEHPEGFPIDVDKGIFLLIYDDELEKELQPIAPKIVDILREEAALERAERHSTRIEPSEFPRAAPPE